VLKLNEGEVLNHRPEVFVELSYEARHVEISIHSVAEGEVVSFSENLNAVWEIPLPSYTFLESGTCCPSAINLSIKEGYDYQLGG